MFETIVWATDGSESAQRAFPYAQELASRNGARLHAVHVVPVFDGGRASGLPVNADEGDIQAQISAQVGKAREEGLEIAFETVRARAGHLPDAIAEFAESVEADVVVVGTRGHSPVAGVLLGSVAQGLLHTVRCPVLAVPPRAGA